MPTVGDVMTAELLVVAPEDTLGEVAERMSAQDVGSALVADYGRLIGILTSRDLLRAFAGRIHSSEARVREWMTAEPRRRLRGDFARDGASPDERAPNHPHGHQNGRLVGLVGVHVVAKALAEHRSAQVVGLAADQATKALAIIELFFRAPPSTADGSRNPSCEMIPPERSSGPSLTPW